MREFRVDSRPNPWDFLNDLQAIQERAKHQKPITPAEASAAFRDTGSEAARARMIARHQNRK